MIKRQLFKIGYWLIASVLIALLLQNSIPNLPAAMIVKFGIEKTKHFYGLRKWVRYFFIAMISLYWGYVAITVAYWYFLELNANNLDKILISPLFIWVVIGFFVLLETIIFNKSKKEENKTITIYSDRKKTTINIYNLAYIESRGEFTLAILIDGSEYKNNIRISEWEQKLNDFVRIHRSFLVNPEFSTLKGNEVVVNAQWNLPISRSYKQKVSGFFNNSTI